MSDLSRREFFRASGIAAFGALASRLEAESPATRPAAAETSRRQAEWVKSLTDPFRERLLRGGTGACFPDRVKQCAEPLRDKPAFDPEEAARLAAAVNLPAAARFEHPMLERVVRVGLAHIDLTFQRDHPKYGIGKYAWAKCDGFPPVIISAVDSLSLWGNFRRAEQLMTYWLNCFIFRDGSIIFQGPSLSEYGQLLTTLRQFVERSGNRAWFAVHRKTVNSIVNYLEAQMLATGRVELLKGIPEDDTRQDVATYFHNNAWLVRGLRDWAALDPDGAGARTLQHADQLRTKLLAAIRDCWPQDPDDWWLPPTIETSLPWPLHHWLDGLWQNGRYDDFRLSLWGHIYYHQAEGHLTAYEVVHMPPGRQSSPRIAEDELSEHWEVVSFSTGRKEKARSLSTRCA